MSKQQYSYTWGHGSPEMEAHQRHMQRAATADDLLLLALDLLLLALVNARTADEALPPWANGPDKNNSGDAFTPDPWHASACAERAVAYINLARRLLAAARKETP